MCSFSNSERGAGFNNRCRSGLEMSEKRVAASAMVNVFDAGFCDTVACTNLLHAMFDGENESLWMLITGRLDEPCLK